MSIVLETLKFFSLEKLHQLKEIENVVFHFHCQTYYEREVVNPDDTTILNAMTLENHNDLDKNVENLINYMILQDRKFYYGYFDRKELTKFTRNIFPKYYRDDISISFYTLSYIELRMILSFSYFIRSISISSCGIDDNALMLFLGVKMDNLSNLDLSRNPITDKGLETLSKTKLFISRYDLSFTLIGKRAMEIIATSFLRFLDSLIIFQEKSSEFRISFDEINSTSINYFEINRNHLTPYKPAQINFTRFIDRFESFSMRKSKLRLCLYK